jgi:hypothetical protein
MIETYVFHGRHYQQQSKTCMAKVQCKCMLLYNMHETNLHIST